MFVLALAKKTLLNIMRCWNDKSLFQCMRMTLDRPCCTVVRLGSSALDKSAVVLLSMQRDSTCVFLASAEIRGSRSNAWIRSMHR